MESSGGGLRATSAGRLWTRAGVAVNGAFPRLTWDLWSARRSAEQWRPSEVAPGIVNLWRRHARPRLTSEAASRILLIVPTADHIDIPWEPGVGNYSFELSETATACLGPDRVQTMRIDLGGSADDWQAKVVATLIDGGFTHCIGRIDIEPNGSPSWEWDRFVLRIRRTWPGVFLPLTYDSAYPYLSMHLDRLTRLHSLVMPVVLDRPITPVIRPHRPAAGPLFLPLSDASMDRLRREVADTPRDLDLTFIGNVHGYPYRAALLAELEAAGLDVVINPQREDANTMPGFSSYARALARSKVTINFSRCNGVPVTQLKTRLLEGSLFGAIVASDSPLYARDYLAEGREFIAYGSPADLRGQLEALFADQDRLTAMREQAQNKAEVLRVRNFWEQVSAALPARGLSPLPLLN
jgi:hypothetical protein